MGAFKNAKKSLFSRAVLGDPSDSESFPLLQMNVLMGLEKSISIEEQSNTACL